MSEVLPFLKSLLSVSGLSGYEMPVRCIIEERWKPLADQTSVSQLGSLHAFKRGSGKEPRRSILIAAHMDAVGLMVSKMVDGFLHISEIGGIDPRILPGTPVIVHGTEDLPGVVTIPPASLLPEGKGNGTVAIEYLQVDIGLTPPQVLKKVRIGDLVSFDTRPVDMSGGSLSGHSLDNRASVAVLTVCLEELQSKSHVWDVWAVASAQEEISCGGATTSSFELKPDLAVAVDTTYGKAPGVNGWESFEIGAGPTLGIGPNIHPLLHHRFTELAEKFGIPYGVEPMPTSSGTDAMAIQISAEGIPTMVISVPIRYMHTPVEMIMMKDIQRAGRLLAEFINGLEVNFMNKIIQEE
jgi:putative aminopeptidase FrvX